MRAFHTFWSRPFSMAHPGQPLSLTDYDLFGTILSALQWRRRNGSIRLVTDRMGERYFCAYGLDFLWDDGMEVILDHIPYSVDPSTFWAAGKLYALRAMHAPCVMLDTDFILWEDLSAPLSSSDLAVIHREELNPDIYPDPRHFLCAEGYHFPDGWDFTQPACNTAFCYFGSETLRQEYVQQSLDFVEASRGRHPLYYMVFAEQRLLAMCAVQNGYTIDSLAALPALFSGQTYFTHLWGYKQLLQKDPEERRRFCLRCARRITADFPDAVARCAIHPLLRPYFIS
ncbi:MAG: hypothetical protein Q4F79_07610 [Eubacteriales bacterium]|nr:hypothetical protein [Eubacteriales bacterium]